MTGVVRRRQGDRGPWGLLLISLDLLPHQSFLKSSIDFTIHVVTLPSMKKAILVRLPPQDWEALKSLVQQRISIPLSDNTIANLLMKEGAKVIKKKKGNL